MSRGRKSNNSNVLRKPINSRSSKSNNFKSNKLNYRTSNSKNSNINKVKKVRNPKQVILMIVILFAFICGLAIGISFIMGDGNSSSHSSDNIDYENVTHNITKYENSSLDLKNEKGDAISYSEFNEDVTEGQNIEAFNASNSNGIY